MAEAAPRSDALRERQSRTGTPVLCSRNRLETYQLLCCVVLSCPVPAAAVLVGGSADRVLGLPVLVDKVVGVPALHIALYQFWTLVMSPGWHTVSQIPLGLLDSVVR